MTLTTRVFVGLALGLVLGVVVASYPSAGLVAAVGIIEPVGTLWVNAIRMTVVPLVVSLLITGVATAADGRVVGRIGAHAFGAFALLLSVSSIVSLVVVPPLFAWFRIDPVAAAALRAHSAAGADVSVAARQVPGLAQWLVDIIPTNPIKAAADGAMLPLVVFTLAFALALLRLPEERREPVVRLFRAIGDAMLVLVRAIIALAPIGVFALTLPVASRTGAAAAGALGYYVVAMAIACTTLILLLYPVVGLVAATNIGRFARAAFPAQAVAASSSSSLASLPALIEGADHRLQLPTGVTGVVLPLAVSTFKVTSPVVWSVAAVFLASFYGVPLPATSRLLVTATAALTSFSVPGVPHGWLLVIAPLVATLGIPAEGIGLLIAVDLIPDIFATTANVTADLVAAAIVARTAGRSQQDAAAA